LRGFDLVDGSKLKLELCTFFRRCMGFPVMIRKGRCDGKQLQNRAEENELGIERVISSNPEL
jgi:hypothetical protein